MGKQRTPNGLHVSRLKLEQNNPREVAFAEQWELQHELNDLLRMLMGIPASSPFGGFSKWKFPIGEPTERDRIVVATVVQWLGSNVGMSFIEEALKRCGYWPPRRKETP